MRHVLERLGTMNKKLWRCHVCNDIHFGVKPPAVCPTCGVKNAFVLVDNGEATKVIDDYGGVINTVEAMVKVWEDFTKEKEFKIVEDREIMETLAKGELENMKSKGLKYCPCRITTGSFEKDLSLICPCNFLVQKTWKEYGECWCGLFVKR
jgi:ferredoxin-thioredoxin reductase catalytic chain